MAPGHPYYTPEDGKYAHLPPGAVPLTESLRDCAARVEPLWRGEIRPALLEDGKTVLVVGHANGLRALIRCVQGLSDAEISSVGVPNAIPLVFEFAPSGRPLPVSGATTAPLAGSYLGDEAARFAMLDSDKSGTLDALELGEAGLCDKEATGEDDEGGCEILVSQLDNNGDGEVDFNEYMNWTRAKRALPPGTE